MHAQFAKSHSSSTHVADVLLAETAAYLTYARTHGQLLRSSAICAALRGAEADATTLKRCSLVSKQRFEQLAENSQKLPRAQDATKKLNDATENCRNSISRLLFAVQAYSWHLQLARPTAHDLSSRQADAAETAMFRLHFENTANKTVTTMEQQAEVSLPAIHAAPSCLIGRWRHC